MSDTRSNAAKARDDFFETSEGKSTMAAIPGLESQFLKNRLESAFIAGYQAAEHNFVNYISQSARRVAERIVRESAKNIRHQTWPFLE